MPATHGARCNSASPPMLRIEEDLLGRIRYEDSGSLQKTGRASFLGSKVSLIPSLRRGRPTSSRFGIVNVRATRSLCRPRTISGTALDAHLTSQAPILMPS